MLNLSSDNDSVDGKLPRVRPDGSARHTKCLSAILRMSGLRPTRQRLSLLGMIMSGPDRHFTIEELFQEAQASGQPLSLATVYNATRQFSEAGIVREVPVDGARTYYDTNTRDHNHYFLEDEQRLVDGPASFSEPAPPGMTVHRVDVLIHLRRSS